eukprot:CAMPEP_0172924884 /NCGR_PEP_ID=MMETSP1075-20121228/212537_1 /TAXON_ID=2916 /ORGANISM="Ceratium fusus, Strain PA161109" /LENGTH=265 /DNA_ID=CAMNT_0013785637 /DNA_START=33 /DNA_END=830 /DNA_ORIENTATION=+
MVGSIGPCAASSNVVQLELTKHLSPRRHALSSKLLSGVHDMEMHVLKSKLEPSRVSSPQASELPMCRLVPMSKATEKRGSASCAGCNCGPLALHVVTPAMEDSRRWQRASAIPFLPVGDANRGSDCCECQQHQPRLVCMKTKAKPFRVKAIKTLLIAYLPRCATSKGVDNAFSLAGIVPPQALNLVSPKCFGFAQFADHDAAMRAQSACAKGTVVMFDDAGKAWHIKASWARAELCDYKKACDVKIKEDTDRSERHARVQIAPGP